MKRYKGTHVATVAASAVFMVVVLVGVVFFAGFWTLGNSYDVSAYVTNARGIGQDSTVFEAGIPIGLVTGVQRSGPDAVLSLRITGGPRPLPVDSEIQLGLRSLAGETDVLLTPGHSRQMVRNGGSLGLSQDQGYTEVDQILKEFAGHTTPASRQFFQGLGGGLKGEGQNLNGTLGGFAQLVTASVPLTSTLAAQHTQVADIVQNLGDVMAAIGQRTQAVQDLARGASQTFEAVASRNQGLRELIDNLHYFATGSTEAMHSVTANSAHVVPVLADLAATVSALTPTLRELSPAAQSGIQVLTGVRSASVPLSDILGRLTQLKPLATSALSSLHALTCQIDPMIRYIGPYGRDLAAFFGDFGAAAAPYDTNHQLLGNLLVDPTHLFRGIESQPISQALTTLLNLGVFKRLASSKLGYNPNDGPGGIGRSDVDVGAVGPADIAANANNPPSNTFPHVSADCATTLPGGFHIG